MVKDDVIIKVTNDMAMVLTNYQLEKLKEVLNSNLEKIEMSVITDEEEKQKEKNTNENYINMFISAYISKRSRRMFYKNDKVL